jgi:hypothetical protein
MTAIYSNGGNCWNFLGFNFTKRDALSSVYKISMDKTEKRMLWWMLGLSWKDRRRFNHDISAEIREDIREPIEKDRVVIREGKEDLVTLVRIHAIEIPQRCGKKYGGGALKRMPKT